MFPSSRFFRYVLILELALSLAVGSPLWGRDLWGLGDSDIIISEIHYRSPGDVAEEEFVEIYNNGVHWVDLSGWTLNEAVEFKIPDGTAISPGEYLAIARSASHVSKRAAAGRVIGDFKGRLGNRGEIVDLRNRTGRTVAWIHYRDGRGAEGGLWPRRPDGRGPSLELIEPQSEWDHPSSWAPSRVIGGTPGRANSASPARGAEGPGAEGKGRSARPGAAGPSGRPRLRVNELDWTGARGFVELYNSGESSLSLDGFLLRADSGGASTELALSGSLGAGKLLHLPADRLGGLLSGQPDIVYVLDTNRFIVDSLSLSDVAQVPEKMSVGRFPDGKRDVFVLASPSPGKTNSAPSLPDVVFSEILYHGSRVTSDDEFVEIHNAGKRTVLLQGWKLEGGIRFEFPEGTRLGPGAHVAVAKKPETLQALLKADDRKRILGPFKGKLSNRGETLVLRDRLGNEVDRVTYDDRAPWPRAADGKGYSVELIDPRLDNRWGEAWTLGPRGGSPAATNVRASKSVPPRIVRVRHEPAVPEPGEEVVFHANVFSTRRLSQVALVYYEMLPDGRRTKGIKKRMSDKGNPEDGAAGDGHYAVKVRLPARRETLYGYRIVARSSSGRAVEAPHVEPAARDRATRARGGPDLASARDFLLTVAPRDDSHPGLPHFRVLMAADVWSRLQGERQGRSKNWYACTLVASIRGEGVNDDPGRLYHNAAIRYRGNNSRRPRDGRYSYRVKLGPGDYYNGRDRLIFNAYDAYRQKAGGDLMKLAGLPAPRARNIRLTTPGFDDLRYLEVEVVDNYFLEDKFGDASGKLFRGFRGNPVAADLRYHGPQPDAYRGVYQQQNHTSDDDISCLIDLLATFDASEAQGFVERIRAIVDVDEWVGYFVANKLVGNDENGLAKGVPDDYYMYQRPSDGRFVLIPWDHDSTFIRVRDKLFRPSLPAIRKLLEHRAFAPLYHRRMRELLDGPFSCMSFGSRIRAMARTFQPEDLRRLEDYVRERQRILRDEFPLWPHAALAAGPADGGESAVGGFGSRLFVTSSRKRLELGGYADPALAYEVRVGGAKADYDGVRGRWSLELPFNGGSAALWVNFLDRSGQRLASYPVLLERAPAVRRVPSSIRGQARWTADKGPYHLARDVVVAAGSTLSIGPGVQVLCGPNARLIVRGRLSVEGAAESPVCFRITDWDRPWRGVVMEGSGTLGAGRRENVLRHCRFEGGSGQESGSRSKTAGSAGEEAAPPPFLRVSGTRVTIQNSLLRGIRGLALLSRGGDLTLADVAVVDCREGVSVVSGKCDIRSCRFRRLSGAGLELISLRGKDSQVRDSSFREIQGTALTVDGCELSIEGGDLSASEAALALKRGARVSAEGLVIVSNNCAVSLDDAARGQQSTARASGGGSQAEMRRCALGPNGILFSAAPSSRVRLEACSLSRDAALPSQARLEGVNRGTPEFVDPLRGDFRLRERASEAAGSKLEEASARAR